MLLEWHCSSIFFINFKNKVDKRMCTRLDVLCDTIYQKTFFEVTSFPYFFAFDVLILI